MNKESNPTAAIIIIGDEILSGRTLDTNTQYLAKSLNSVGIDLIETRTIHDDMDKIISTALEFSENYDYVFTSGGIGPTHDDITSESLAKAFGLKYTLNQEAYHILSELYGNRNEEVTPARAKMAWMPEDAKLITYNPPSAPGFIVKNVYVLAGVPHIFQAMVNSIIDGLKHGRVILSKNIDILLGESVVAEEFEALQKKYKDVMMGSYPFIKDGYHGTSLVIRSRNEDSLISSYKELAEILERLKKQHHPIRL